MEIMLLEGLYEPKRKEIIGVQTGFRIGNIHKIYLDWLNQEGCDGRDISRHEKWNTFWWENLKKTEHLR
jgi:hypothetical protein